MGGSVGIRGMRIVPAFVLGFTLAILLSRPVRETRQQLESQVAITEACMLSNRILVLRAKQFADRGYRERARTLKRLTGE